MASSSTNSNFLLTVLILVGLVLGIIFGSLAFDPNWSPSTPISLHRHAELLSLADLLGNTIFMGLLKMMILPLIASSVIYGITSVGDFRALGRLGAITFVYYLTTMVLAVVSGLVIVTILQPGAAMQGMLLDPNRGIINSDTLGTTIEGASLGFVGVIKNLLSQMIPQNFLKAIVDGAPLPLIVFSILFGIVVTTFAERAGALVKLIEIVFEVLMKMVGIILWLAPVGVFALLFLTIAKIGLGVFSESIGLFMFTVLSGLALHGLVTLPLILLLLTRSNPFRFMHQMRQALMTAFATDSSSATLPVTIECATCEAGIRPRSAGLVLPLGSTVNMDGTALYEGIAVVFIAQASGIELGLVQMVVIVFTATLAAIGAAGIPSAGLVTMVVVIEAVNQSLQAINPNSALLPIAAIGLILGVDRILDMFRTVVNVWGDAVGAKIVDKFDSKIGV